MSCPVVILAGGLATRLRPITEKIPKSLLEINGEPFVFHQLRLLQSKGVTEVIFCCGFLGEMIEAAVGDGAAFSINVSYSHDGDVLRGTGGAIQNALPLIKGDIFMITYGDSYLDCDYAALEDSFEHQPFAALMSIYRNNDLLDTSNIDYDGEKIVLYSKKEKRPSMSYIDYGLSIVDKSIFLDTQKRHNFDLAEIFENLSRNGKLGAFEVYNRFYEIGSFQGIEETTAFLKTKLI